MGPEPKISRHLRRHGLRATRPGRLLLAALRRLKRPATAKDLHRALGERRVDRATVHRLLRRFERAGLVRTTHLHGLSQWYEPAESGAHYHHLVCTGCRRVERFSTCALGRLLAAARRESGFEVRSHSVTLFGRCARCRRLVPAL